jgi:hypothetical protein
MRPLVAVGLALVVLCPGCVTGIESGTPEAAGEVAAEVTTEPPKDVTPQSLSTVDNEFIRQAVKRAVAAYKTNDTAERVVVPVPKPAFGDTRDSFRQLPEPSADSFYGRLVVHRNTTVRVQLIEYA